MNIQHASGERLWITRSANCAEFCSLEIANSVVVLFCSQIVVDVVVDVLAEEADSSVTKQEVGTANVARFESEFFSPVIVPVAAG